MISPSLWTYSFYRDNAEKQERREKLENRLIELGQSRSILDYEHLQRLSVWYMAMPPHPPICSSTELEIAKTLLNEKLIDAFSAGISTNKRSGYTFHAEGNLFALALDRLTSAVNEPSPEELNQVLELIAQCNAGTRPFEYVVGPWLELNDTLRSKCTAAGYDFKFLKPPSFWANLLQCWRGHQNSKTQSNNQNNRAR